MSYYQLEFLWDKKGGFEFDKEHGQPDIITSIRLTKTKPYWALAGGERIMTKAEAITRAERRIREDDKSIAHDKRAIEYQMAHYTGEDRRYIIPEPHETPWRVVEVSRNERRVVWMDPRLRR